MWGLNTGNKFMILLMLIKCQGLAALQQSAGSYCQVIYLHCLKKKNEEILLLAFHKDLGSFRELSHWILWVCVAFAGQR